ncbi:MAG: sigma-54 dependent transcriptional regulator [Candidatus Margulisiibacteriota bacterium]
MAKIKPLIAVVDDEDDILRTIKAVLKNDYNVATFQDPQKAFSTILSLNADILLLDIKMPSFNGIDFLRAIKKDIPDLEVIVVTAMGDSKNAISAMKLGAYDYINKPFDVEELKVAIEKALGKRCLAKENRAYRAAYEGSFYEIIGGSDVMKKLFELVAKIAPADSTVLITGETGSGKELVARAVHKSSKRAAKPFVAVNCAAIPENLFETELFGHEKGSFTGAFERKTGRFEYADGGTIFLDEIGCLSTALQAKLLRVLQEGEISRVGGSGPVKIDVRVICATNMDLFTMVKRGAFRQDLFYRLNVIPVNVPALRERGDDITVLFYGFLDRFNKKFGKNITRVSAQFIEALKSYNWPGNVRELENTAERIAALSCGEVLEIEDLPADIRNRRASNIPLNEILDKCESQHLLEALSLTGWNQSKAADILKIDRSTLISKMKKHSIQPQPTNNWI